MINHQTIQQCSDSGWYPEQEAKVNHVRAAYVSSNCLTRYDQHEPHTVLENIDTLPILMIICTSNILHSSMY
jgi:hypothetical protein